MGPCGDMDDDPPDAASWAELSTSNAIEDATVGRPLSVYVQYVVDRGESCGGEFNKSCGCTDPGPSPAMFDVADVRCDDDACELVSVSELVSAFREVVIVPKRETVTVRARLTSPDDDEPEIAGELKVELPR